MSEVLGRHPRWGMVFGDNTAPHIIPEADSTYSFVRRAFETRELMCALLTERSSIRSGSEECLARDLDHGAPGGISARDRQARRAIDHSAAKARTNALR
jgi:hypothetical protein